MSIINRNSIINVFLIAISIYLALQINLLFILIWPIVLLIDDFAFYLFKKSLFDSEQRVRAGYQFAHIYLDGAIKEGRDLGFNLYNGDLDKSKHQSQQDKWDFMLKALELKAGDSLIDIGCGYGEWLNYAKSKGINVVGVNITPEQANHAKNEFKIDVVCVNWKDILHNQELQNKLYGKFDAVTFMDTVEHYVSLKDRYDLSAQAKIYSAMFDLANRLMKKNSSSARIFISCLHTSKKIQGIREYLGCYLLDKYHSGFYPDGDDGLVRYSQPYFKLIARYDRTEDYRLTSVLDRRHFGAAKIQWNLRKILYLPLLFLADPHHIYKWVAITTDNWMWWHFGDDAYRLEYDNEYQKSKRRVTLWWLVLEQIKAETQHHSSV